ncbi:MAG: type II secretion system major pseudopilin GspG [Xanthomonadales bacterium]|nr:type II secretion system major pseudopilin GspG [Xanthomonadales bacterium]
MLHALPRNRAGGFSLIEMVAVLVLIGIVATLVVRGVAPQFGRGQVNAAKSQVKIVAAAVENFYMDTGSYPNGLQELVTRPSGVGNDWGGPYIREAQLKDPWGTDLVYRLPGQHGDFDIVSLGRDKQPGGDGNNADIGSWQ